MEQLDIEALKSDVHRTLISKLDLEKLSRVNSTQARDAVARMVNEIITSQKVPLNFSEQERVRADLLDEVFGLGPLEPLLRDGKISDILVNGKDHVFIERAGLLSRVDTKFRDDRHLLQIIDRIVSRIGRRVDESSPMVDARLADGSRINAIIPPLAVDGPMLSIRRFGSNPLGVDDLLRNLALTPPMMELLKGCVKARLNIIISGGTGSGKTTLLNTLSSFISERERIVTIEDSAELQLNQDHVVRLETRPPNVEGRGAIKQRELVINALRMRPDRVILGEVRGEETLDMLQAMNTGHDGSLATIHSNTPRDALARLETMALMGEVRIAEKAIRAQIAAAVHIIVQASRMSDGTRRVTHITELTGAFSDVISMQDIFLFEKKGIGPNGKVKGTFHATGIVPKCVDKMAAAGFTMPAGYTSHTLDV